MDEDMTEEESLLFILLRRRPIVQKPDKSSKRKQYGEYDRLTQELETVNQQLYYFRCASHTFYVG